MQVAAVIRSTEQALSKADILTQQLGVGDGSISNAGSSRSEVLRKRKVLPACQPPYLDLLCKRPRPILANWACNVLHGSSQGHALS